MNNVRGVRLVCSDGTSLYFPDSAIVNMDLASIQDGDKRIKMTWNDGIINAERNIVQSFGVDVDLTKMKGSRHVEQAVESDGLLQTVLYIMSDRDVYVFKPGVIAENRINHGLSYQISGNRLKIGLDRNYGNKRVVIENESEKNNTQYPEAKKR